MDCGMPGIAVHHQLLEFTQTHVHWVCDATQPSYPLLAPFPQFFPASGSFQMSQLFASGGQSIGVSASTSILPVNIQDWFPLGWTSHMLQFYNCNLLPLVPLIYISMPPFKWICLSFSPLTVASLLFSTICWENSWFPQTTILPFCIYSSWGWFWSLPSVQC